MRAVGQGRARCSPITAPYVQNIGQCACEVYLRWRSVWYPSLPARHVRSVVRLALEPLQDAHSLTGIPAAVGLRQRDVEVRSVEKVAEERSKRKGEWRRDRRGRSVEGGQEGRGRRGQDRLRSVTGEKAALRLVKLLDGEEGRGPARSTPHSTHIT